MVAVYDAKTTLSLLLKLTHAKYVESVKWLTTEQVVRSPQNTADKTTVLLDQGQIRGYSDAKIKLKVKDSACYETAIRLFSSQKNVNRDAWKIQIDAGKF